MDRNKREEGEQSTKEVNNSHWKALWNLKTPGPVKHFIWRAYHDLLPTQMNFAHRKIMDQTLCPIC